jgi:hypothetical protein
VTGAVVVAGGTYVLALEVVEVVEVSVPSPVSRDACRLS